MLPVTIVLCTLVLGAHLVLVLGLDKDLEDTNAIEETEECDDDSCPCATSSLGCPAVVRALPCKPIAYAN